MALTLATSAQAKGPKPTATNEPPYFTPSTMPTFFPNPDVTKNDTWVVKNLGPVGIGIDLKRPGMTMVINNVEKGSPAEATGKLQKGQIIESINGKVLKEVDPRILLGDFITEAEAKDGKVVLKIQGVGDVLVQIPVMGAYSKTWPLNCPKSDKIVRQHADLLAKEEKPGWGSVIFLLSTGEEKDLEVVKRWMKGIETIGGLNWEKGYKGPGLCEYYLRTGDASVLPVIKKMTEELKGNMFSGGWSGRGAPAAFTYSTGTGQLHAAGVHCMTFLLMAKLCGVDVDSYMFDECFQQFYRFAGHGNVAYGNGLPEGGFRDNGKTGGLAVAMAAAAMVDPQGEKSVYAMARDNSAMKSFYAQNWFHAAHTGGGIGEIWHHAGVSLMREKRPVAYRSYIDSRRWVMDLSRRFDGSIGIAGMLDGYDKSCTEDSKAWGTFFALTYTYPRKQLQLFGAPRSKWAKTTPLPRPWGNAADDCFQSPEPIPGGPLTMQDLLNERVETDASYPAFNKMRAEGASDEVLWRYLHHPEYGLRNSVMDVVTKQGRDDIVLKLLMSSDPRLRECGLLGLTGMFKGSPLPADKITPEMYALVGRMINDPNESWWVVLQAIEALARTTPQMIAPYRDRLLQLADYDSVWIQTAAVCALAKICNDPQHCKVVLPTMLKRAATFRVDSASGRTTRAIADAMKAANPEVKEYATPMLKKVYASMPGVLAEPNTGAVLGGGGKVTRSRVGNIIQQLPGGEEFVRSVPKTTLASFISGRDSDMYVYKGTFQTNPKLVGEWAWAVYPAPSKPDEIDSKIETWLKNLKGKDPKKVDKPKDVIQLADGGKVAKSKFYGGYFWSGDRLIGINDDQALKMEVRSYGGYDFLILEKGNFTAPPAPAAAGASNEPKSDGDTGGSGPIPKDYHCGYHVYIKQK